MADANRTPHDGLTIDVNITPTIERDYRRRDVFPALRIEHTRRFINATGVYSVSIVEAEEILKDAEARLSDRSLPRGTPKAFSSLAERLTAALKSAMGLWDDPGMDVARQRLQDSPAQFRVGERVRYWSEWIDDERDGALLEIVDAFALQLVAPCENGEYVDKDGVRIAYRWGYGARPSGGDTETIFYPAYKLQRLDYKRGHLRLVEACAPRVTSARS